MTDDGDMIDIIHGSPTHSLIIPFEPHRLNEIDCCSHTGGEPQNGANISGNSRLEQSNSHRARLSQSFAALNARSGWKADVTNSSRNYSGRESFRVHSN